MRGRLLWVVLIALGLGLGVGIASMLGRITGPQGPVGEIRADREVPAEAIRVEVLNGAGRAGYARVATAMLRDAGFDVVYFGNAPAFDTDSSVVIDRVGRPEEAAKVARAAGIARVRSEPDPARILEATVLLGRDWRPDRDAINPLFRVDTLP